MTNRLSPKSTSEAANTDDAQTPARPGAASTAVQRAHQDPVPPAPSSGIHGWYYPPPPYPPGYSWLPQPYGLVPPTTPLQPVWNSYRLAAHATQSAVPIVSPPPLQPTIIANPYAGSPIEYINPPPVYQVPQVPQVYHSGFHPTSPPHPAALGYNHPYLTLPQPTPAGQFQGPTQPSSYHSVDPGAERASHPALSSTSRADASVPQCSCGSGAPIGRQIERPKRTKQTPFAMWVGNIDSTVTVQELYEFFRQIDLADAQSPAESAVVSIFLIPKSNCAFVNYRTEAALTESVTRFHGVRLRLDSGAPRLACRKRTADHCDLDSEWDEVDDEKGVQGNSDVPQTSPNARYFIMKSLTHTSLQESVENGMWATQLHNEAPLDKAYRSCEVAYLVFGANKSGEFFGYAKMNGPIFDEEYSSNGTAESDGSTVSEERRWGKPFPIEWIRKTPLSFKRTQHLQDPWNQNREVKISTDGQEIPPSIGRKLLALWN